MKLWTPRPRRNKDMLRMKNFLENRTLLTILAIVMV